MATPTAASSSSIIAAAATATASARVSTITPTIIATAGQLYTVSIAASPPAQSAAAQSILDRGAHLPNAYNANNPLPLFIIQAVIIIALSRLLAWPLAKLRQPRVISEVVGGIILGPSIMGRIPGFTKAIFPTPSIPLLSLVANIGLVLFLFLVGLEADFSVFKKNAKAAIGISVFGLIVPFGLGAAISVGIYNRFVDTSDVNFGIFLLFIGTAMAITAFPVLARILTELKMLNNHVGLTVLAAGVGNDVVGWILLALSVALANAGNGVTAVYILLVGAGLCLFLSFIVRPAFVYLVRRSGSYERGPTPGILTLIFFITLATAFITDIIGIHAIFGSFLVGLIVVPHHHGFAAALTEKIEDLVTILFIPLYFALSGLKTDLGLLNNGAIWGWVVAVIVVAFVGKFVPCAGVAKICGFDVRESLAVGSLMSCKGLVELIVLNIGLQAGILNNEIFAMFVVMALVTTFITTPLTMWFYPESYWRSKGEEQQLGPHSKMDDGVHAGLNKGDQHFRRNFVVVLERLESLPSMMAFVRLLGSAITSPKAATIGSSSSDTDSVDKSSIDASAGPDTLVKEKDAGIPSASQPAHSSNITVDGFRLLALSERTSDIMKASESDITKKVDPILNIFKAFASLASLRHTTSMSIVAQEMFAETVSTHAASRNADMVIIPWAAGASLNPDEDGPSGNPLEGLFGQQAIERSPQYAAFVRQLFVQAESDVGLFLDAGASANASSSAALGGHNHIFLPFHGGPDDRAALDFVMQLVANNSYISATVSRFVKTAESDDSSKEAESSSSPITATNQLTIGAGLGVQDTVYAGAGTQHRLASDTADNLALARYFPAEMTNSEDANLEAPLLPQAIARTTFETIVSSTPLRTTLTRLEELSTSSRSVLLILGRSRRSAPSHRIELERFLKGKVVAGHGLQTLGIAASSEVRKTLGDLGSAAVVSGQASSILILQSAVKGEAYINKSSKKGKSV